MNLYSSELYISDLKEVADLPFINKRLAKSSVAIAGGTGMIGSFLVDVLMYRNEHYGDDIDVYVLGRNEDKARQRFCKYAGDTHFKFFPCDINKPLAGMGPRHVDYVIHAASNTHPIAYANDPIGTISANVIGTDNLLAWAAELSCKRFVFLSSVEIYGENRGDTDKFDETYSGYIDCNTMRAGYPESKRTGEALCQAYRRQKALDIVIPRLSRVYGPTMLASDTKAMSQFIIKSVNGEDIILKSEGTQQFSYSYVADAVSGILKIMLDGDDGEAYNVASDYSDIMLKELAKYLSRLGESRVIYELPDAAEAAGYSKATKALLSLEKIKSIGWQSSYDIKRGLCNTVNILRTMSHAT